MTTRPIVSIAQLDALEAAAEGTLTRPDEKFPHWRIGDGLAVTPSARALLARALIEETGAAEYLNPITFEIERVIYARITAAGRELLEDLRGRAPRGKA